MPGDRRGAPSWRAGLGPHPTHPEKMQVMLVIGRLHKTTEEA